MFGNIVEYNMYVNEVMYIKIDGHFINSISIKFVFFKYKYIQINYVLLSIFYKFKTIID